MLKLSSVFKYMYPNFQLILEALFGYKMPYWLSAFHTFRFFALIAFLTAIHITTTEIKRLERTGILRPAIKSKLIGNAPTVEALFLIVTVTFIAGFGISELLWNITTSDSNIVSSALGENLILGLAAAFSFGYIRYKHIKRQQLAESRVVSIYVYPHQRISALLIFTLATGLIGPKIVHLLKTWSYFVHDPVHNLFSTHGLTFYGGLLFALFTVYFFSKKAKISFVSLCDAAAPGMMLAYAIRRLGCHITGDRDWGIFNSAYITGENGKLLPADPKQYEKTLEVTAGYFKNNFGDISRIPHISFTAPSWMPDWLVATNYPHNLVREGITLKNCEGQFCSVLPVGVLPISLYESIICTLLFLFIWILRKRIKCPFQLFGIYLLLAGCERLLIEKIRLNYFSEWTVVNLTQPEIISLTLITIGIIPFFIRKKWNKAP